MKVRDGVSRSLRFAGLLLPPALSAVPASAISLGEMSAEAATDLGRVPGFIAVFCYVVGAAFVAVGLMKLKRNVDQPQQVSMGAAIAALIVGAGLIVAPTVMNAIAESFGVGSAGGTLSRPTLP